jgi:D-alanyl-D-alanine carboxypeptidase
MDKQTSDFYFYAAGYFLLVCAVLVLSTSNPVESKIQDAPKVVEPLLCFNIESSELRTSDTESGCLAPEEPLGTAPIIHSEIRPTQLDRTFEVRFLAAQAAASLAGFDIRITSGFRSQQLQERLFKDAVAKYGSENEASKWVLPKDISHHPWGIAIDVNYPGDKVATKWLEDNGSQFGLCRVYENEWWHFEPVIAPGQPCPPMMANALESLPTLDMADIK